MQRGNPELMVVAQTLACATLKACGERAFDGAWFAVVGCLNRFYVPLRPKPHNRKIA